MTHRILTILTAMLVTQSAGQAFADSALGDPGQLETVRVAMTPIGNADASHPTHRMTLPKAQASVTIEVPHASQQEVRQLVQDRRGLIDRCFQRPDARPEGSRKLTVVLVPEQGGQTVEIRTADQKVAKPLIHCLERSFASATTTGQAEFVLLYAP